jgi:hypothetical protein
MTEEAKPKPTELVYRGLVRVPAELETRAPKDDQDFVRRKKYKKTGGPENGLSVFRKEKFRKLQDLWDRMRMSNPVGVSECMLKTLEDKGLKFITDDEHISIRCSECDMAKLPDKICKPKDATDHWACPFFDIDRFDLEQAFELVQAPAVRTLTTKKTK